MASLSNRDQALQAFSRLKAAYPDAKYYLNFSTPLELVVAAILSAQARDEVVNATTEALFKRYRRAEDYVRAGAARLAKEIKNISFAAKKAKNIVEVCRILVERHGGRVPRTLDALTALPGIGRKTANTILINAFDIVSGVPVDTHVIRLARRLGFSRSSDPDVIEQDLMRLFPQSEWKRLPYVLKAHGKAVCRAPVPECSRCVVESLCPKVGVTRRQ